MSRRRVIAFVTFLGGAYFFLKFFLPPRTGGDFLRQQYPWTMLALSIMGGVAVGIGVINIFRVYGRKVVRAEKDRPEAAALIIAFIFTTVVGFGSIFSKSEEGFWNGVYWNVLFRGLFLSLGAAMFSLLAFYITQAAFRAFRVKSIEAALIMTSALLIMLGSLPMPVFEQQLP
ncbi:MAG TPA: hypothetical protein ENN09_01980, partial [Planctomycetes bacterium]|nr:hypothetical protein [Planctomycetota bacterium]